MLAYAYLVEYAYQHNTLMATELRYQAFGVFSTQSVRYEPGIISAALGV